jgi:serine phosphatase RsbU (regulator of sigma subunit)
LAYPLSTKGEVLGTMIVDYSGPRQPARRWRNILTGIAGQAAIAVESDRLLKEAAEQERMKQELDVARRIQTSFLPESCPSIPGWDVAAIWRSAREVAGDFYDFIPLPGAGEMAPGQARTGLVIADVADKGVPAALFMALSRTLVRTMAADGRPPAAAIARANDLIVADARSSLFVTLFYAILESESGAVTYLCAGHMPPLLVRAGGDPAEELRTEGIALGILPGFEFEERTAHLHPGDTIVLYTDGITDAANADGERFERERLIQVITAHRTQPAEELAQTINEAIVAFVGNAPQFDDFTLVVAKRLPT